MANGKPGRPRKPPIDAQEVSAVAQAAKTELCRRSLKEFLVEFWPVVESYRFFDNWHLDCLCDHLAHAKEIGNLLITLPPRQGKTTIIDVLFPAWTWASKPQTKFFYATYSLDLSIEASLKCRRLILSDKYQKHYGEAFKLDPQQNTKERYDTDKGGFRFATSTAGASTGFGCDILVCNDATNLRKVESEADRRAVINWFEEAWYSRVNDYNAACRIVVGQRVHKYDLAGHLLENRKEDWTHLNIPYEYRPVSGYVGYAPLKIKDPRTEPDQHLWPTRFPDKEIKGLKRNRATWETQWNQNPTHTAESLFRQDQFKYYKDEGKAFHFLQEGEERRIDKAECWKLTAADLAMSAKGDYNVFLSAFVAPSGEIFLEDCFRQKMAAPGIIPHLHAHYQKFLPAYVLIEDIGFAKLIIAELKAMGLPVKPIFPQGKGDKEVRSIPLQMKFEGEQVFFPRNAAWTGEAQRELLEFPGGLHDDIVDAMAYVAYEAARRTRGRSIREEEVAKVSEQEMYNRLIWAGTD